MSSDTQQQVSGLRICRLQPEDYQAKAQVHAQTWQETYEGVLPDWLVDKITPEFALEVTKRHGRDATLVAKIGDQLVGFAEYIDPARAPIASPNTAELGAIYVLQAWQGQGIGRGLFQAVARAVSTPRLALWVQEANRKAQSFYRAMGMHPTGQVLVEDDGSNRSLEYVNFDSRG
ncbi:N-acetyltransferase [Bombiscardovia nodaiensis]|uniref:N-acetyltransferase n=1 Tax=Bombiscardovia nodaiensis TaxID=2932181 RepID=A0ABN6SCC9_9BIFI|nr:N-acetyltransferase [Bombiscardovia nodaiensis]